MGCIRYRSRQQAGFGQDLSLPTLFWSSHSEGVKGLRGLTEARKQPKAARVMQMRGGGGGRRAPLCHTGPQLEWLRVIIISVLQSIKQLGQPTWEEATSIIFFR